jgi:hypothetical protein
MPTPARLPLARLLRLTPCIAMLQGCAAILGSKTTEVTAVSQPPGAEVYLDGARVGVTPDTISVESKKSHTLVLKLEGYKEDSCVLTSSVDAGWVILDVLLGGLVGVIVDAATGEWNELTRKSCDLVLSPATDRPPPARGDAPRQPAVAREPAIQPYQSSAPNEIVSERYKAERRTVVGVMLRTGLATTVEQGPPGIVRVGIGNAFHSHQAREYYFAQLAYAYDTWTVDDHPLVIELWEHGEKIGEYVEQTFHTGPGYTTPLDCPENAATGLCSSLSEPLRQEAPRATSEPGRPDAAEPEPAAGKPAPAAQGGTQPAPRTRSGLHFGLGLGAGAVDLTCKGCDIASETGFSGFISLAVPIGEKTLLGIESTGWIRSESEITTRVYSLMAHVTEYTSITSPVFLRAGLGVVGYSQDDVEDLSARALGFSGRLGYEIGSGGVVLVPYVGFTRTFGGAELRSDGEEVGFDFAISNFQFGLSIGAH